MRQALLFLDSWIARLLRWGVIAQRPLEKTLEVARITDLNRDAKVFVGVAVFAILGILGFQILKMIEELATPWRKELETK